ncbi:putative ribonuclease H-like domain-containing protein [Tanacetum coccineum]
MDHTIDVTSTPTLRIHKIHPQSQIIGKSTAGILTRRKLKESASDQHQALLSFIYKQNRTNHKDQQTCLFACFLSQEEPKKVSQALADESWVEAMQEELLQFKHKEYVVLCTYNGKRVQTSRKVDYDKVFSNQFARIEAIRLLFCLHLSRALLSIDGSPKSAILYGNITEEHGYKERAIDKTLFIKKDRRDIMLVQVYVDDIIFGSTKSSMVKDFEDLMQKEFKKSSMGELTFFFLGHFKTLSKLSPIEAHKSLGKDEEGEEVDVHLYRSMIGCLMYLTASRPDIMFAVCLCARFQVTPKVSHIHAVKRIFRANQLQRMSISWNKDWFSWQMQRNKHWAISSTEAEYVAAASCCAQVLAEYKTKLNTRYSKPQGTAEVQVLVRYKVRVLPKFAETQKVRNLRTKETQKEAKEDGGSSVKLGRNNDEGNLSEEHHDNDDEGFDATVTPDFERKSEEALERKSNETEQVNIEEEKDASNVKSGDTEELDLRVFAVLLDNVAVPKDFKF